MALSSLGKKERKNEDCFKAHLSEMEPVIKAKREALAK